MDSLAGYERVGPQLNGSNPAGQYMLDGNRYYIKGTSQADRFSFARMQNEILAGKLMQAAGAGAAETHLIDGLPADMGGSTGIASRMIDGSDVFPITPASLKAVQADFAVHAWLANHDVIGGWHNNTVLLNGKACNIDAGGAMVFRARGSLKYPSLPFGAMPADVPELETMRDLRVNGPAAQFYGPMSEDEIRVSAGKVARITNEVIETLVGKYGYDDEGVKSKLYDSLVARKYFIIKKLNNRQLRCKDSSSLAASVQRKELYLFLSAREHISIY